MVTLEAARVAKTRLIEKLEGLPGLRGVGITEHDESGYAVQVNLAHDAAADAIVNEIDGVPVVIERVGEIRAL